MRPPPPPPQLLTTTAAAIFILATCFPPSLICSAAAAAAAAVKPNSAGIRGALVFGSSLVDNGNNNFLAKALAKSNYPPYGIDFPGGPTGRYTNGKNVLDFITDQLGLPPIPPSRDPSTTGASILRGVDFASGGSGILDETGSITGQVISLNEQIHDFESSTLPELEQLLGCPRGELLPNYLFLVGTGGNDYTLNYFLNLTNPRPNLDAFTSNLISSLSATLLHLRSLGARKFGLMAIYPLGCTPSARQRSPGTTGCVAPLNFAAQLFNAKLKSMVDTLNQQQPESKFVMINAYGIIDEILNKPALAGFSDTVNPCCESTTILCNRGGAACNNRRAYVFFDGLHTTDAVNLQIATRAYASTCQDDVYPINIGQLAML